MKINNISVYNTYPAIISIRNATKTWKKSDTKKLIIKTGKKIASYNHAEVGPLDKDLISRLLKSSKESGRPNHRKFLRQILVSFDLTAPKSFWSVFDSYKIGVTTNDSNTMPLIKSVVNKKQKLELVHFEHTSLKERRSLKRVINDLNREKDVNLITTLLPQSFLLIKSWTGSYENLINIYQDQCTNEFYQWKIIVDAIKKMPLMKDLIIPNSIYSSEQNS